MSQPGYTPPHDIGQSTQSSPHLGTQPGNQYGSPQGYYATPPASTTTNPWAIASLALGLCATAILAVIAGHIALAQINRTGEQGRGLAIAGLVIGYASIIGYIALIAGILGFLTLASQG